VKASRREELRARVEALTTGLGEIELLFLRDCITARLVKNRRAQRTVDRLGVRTSSKLAPNGK